MSNLPEWDLTDFYPNYKSKKVLDEINHLKTKITNFCKKYKSKLSELSHNELILSIKSYEKIEEVFLKLRSYAYLTYCTDQLNPEKKKFYQFIDEKLSELEKKIIFFSIEINKIDKKKYGFLLKSKFENWIKNLRKNKKFQKSETIEKLLLEKSITSSAAWIKFYDQTMTRLRFKYGNKDLTETEILNLFTSHKESIRKNAAESFGETLKKNIFNFSYITNILSKDLDIEKNLRGFEFSESSRHLSNQIDKEDIDSLVNTVRSNYSKISHRYYKYKANCFNKKKLNFWDKNAPYKNLQEEKITWDEAKEIVLAAYFDFDNRIGNVAKKFFDNKWIHASLGDGKTSGAFSHPTVPSSHPYILLNYQNKIRDVMTLAHELGHGVHQFLANKNGLFLSETPLTLAETASVFGEMLTFKFLLEKTKKKSQKLSLLRGKIEDMLNTDFRQIAFFVFERELHLKRSKGELSEDEICKIWIRTQNESLGDFINLSGNYKYFWAYIPHFIHSPFYVYAYAFGDCLVNSLYSRYEENFTNFNDQYLKLLKSGGSKNYKVLLRSFNLNPKNKDFWQMGLNLIKNFIDELEQLN